MPSGRSGTEQKHHLFFYSYCTIEATEATALVIGSAIYTLNTLQVSQLWDNVTNMHEHELLMACSVTQLPASTVCMRR